MNLALKALTVLAVLWSSFLAVAASKDAVGLEKRMIELRQKAETLKDAQDWDGAIATIREMAALDPQHPKVYLQVMLVELRRGKLDEASALMDTLGLPSGAGRTYGRGVSSLMKGQSQEASRAFAECLRDYRSKSHVPGQAACHFGLALVAKNSSETKEAIRQYAAASGLLDKIEDERAKDDIRHETAGLEALQGHHDMALRLYRESLAFRVKLGDSAAQAQSWHGIGLSSLAKGDREASKAAFDQALEIRRQLKDWQGQVSTLEELSKVYAVPEELDKRMEILGEALEVAEAVPDARSRGDVTVLQARALLAAGRNRDAVGLFESAAGFYKGTKDVRGEASALGGLGLALNRVGEYSRARGILESALELARASKTPAIEAAALADLGNSLLAVGEPAEALLHYEHSLAILRNLEDRPGQLQTLNSLYAVHYDMGLLDRARFYLEQALGLEAQGDRAGIARSRSNLGVLLAEEGRAAEALAQFRQAIRLRGDLGDARGTAVSCASAAVPMLRLGKMAEATRSLTEALENARRIGDRGTEAYALDILGDVQLASGKAGAALESHRRALELATESGNAEERRRAHSGMASSLERLGQRAAALEESLRAIDELESFREGLVLGEFKMRFLAGKRDLYESALMRLLPARGSFPDAEIVARGFQLAERAKARSLLDLLAESRSRLRAKLPGPLVSKEQQVLEDLRTATARLAESESPEQREEAKRRIDESRARIQDLEIEVRRAAPRTGGILFPRTISLEEVQSRILRDDEVLLEYFIGSSRAWLWVVDRNGATLRDLGSPDEVARAVRAFLDKATVSGSGLGTSSRDVDAAERLSAAVLPRGVLGAGKRILVVADGPLQSIPFETLRVGGRFLIETYEVSVVPSAAVIGLLRSAPAPLAARGFLGVGDPIPSATGKGETALPFSRHELETVGQLFPEGERTVLTGPRARSSELRELALDKFRFVHFATHGWIDADPRYSGLRLSAGAQGPGDLLSIDEIVSLPLASEVVVLSACRSGVGEQLAGEGTVGLARAFLYAGSRSVVASLWDVGDRSTASLMSSFYTKLQHGESPSGALRHAKLEFLTSDVPSRRRIHAWAPFVLVGDPEGGTPHSNRQATSATHP